MSALLPDPALPAGLARASTPEEVGFGADRLKRLVDGFAAHAEQAAIPGAVLFVARHGKVACLTAVGWRDRESADPMPVDAIFRGASITKPLTVAGPLALVDGVGDVE